MKKKRRPRWRPGMNQSMVFKPKKRKASRVPPGDWGVARDAPRPNVTPAPLGPRKRTWIRGTLTFDGDYVPHVGGESLARVFAEFDGKRVRITIEVLP